MTYVPKRQAVRKCHYSFRQSRQIHAVFKMVLLPFLCKSNAKATAFMLFMKVFPNAK